MRICSKCEQEFDDNKLFCSFDGEMLKDNIILIGKYAIREKIGGGGMGFVYEAENLKLRNKKVAIKILRQETMYSDPQAKNRFKQEAEIIAHLEHDNIIKVIDFDIDSNYAFFVMDFLSGKTLEQKIQDPETLSLDEISSIFSQICAAIDYAHKKGILHRDLKPANIFLIVMSDGKARIKVLDFGVAKILDPEQTKLTKTHSIIGTPSYMSPEQFNSHKDIDERSDIYSLGIILYEMLCGKVPFQSESFIELLRMHEEKTPKSISESGRKVSRQIEEVVKTALAKRREERQQSVGQLAKDFNLAIQKYETEIDEGDIKKETIPNRYGLERDRKQDKGKFYNDFSGATIGQVNPIQADTINIETLLKSESRNNKSVKTEEDENE